MKFHLCVNEWRCLEENNKTTTKENTLSYNIFRHVHVCFMYRKQNLPHTICK